MEQVAESSIVMELIFVPLNLQMKTCVIMASLSANRVNTHEQQVPFIMEGKNYYLHPVTQAISRGPGRQAEIGESVPERQRHLPLLSW